MHRGLDKNRKKKAVKFLLKNLGEIRSKKLKNSITFF